MTQNQLNILDEKDTKRLYKKKYGRPERVAKKEKRLRELEALPPVDDITVIKSGVADLKEHIDEGSIDFIITDPPYPKKYLDCYNELSYLAEYALKDGGEMFVMIGHAHLPEFLKRLSVGSTINYNWCYATYMGGPTSFCFPQRARVRWKPVLHFVKGKMGRDKFFKIDFLKGEKQGRDHNFELHKWQQGEGIFHAMFDYRVYRNHTVLDPFCGSGTTGVVALQRGVKCIMSDIDDKAIEITNNRLRSVRNTL